MGWSIPGLVTGFRTTEFRLRSKHFSRIIQFDPDLKWKVDPQSLTDRPALARCHAGSKSSLPCICGYPASSGRVQNSETGTNSHPINSMHLGTYISFTDLKFISNSNVKLKSQWIPGVTHPIPGTIPIDPIAHPSRIFSIHFQPHRYQSTNQIQLIFRQDIGIRSCDVFPSFAKPRKVQWSIDNRINQWKRARLVDFTEVGPITKPEWKTEAVGAYIKRLDLSWGVPSSQVEPLSQVGGSPGRWVGDWIDDHSLTFHWKTNKQIEPHHKHQALIVSR